MQRARPGPAAIVFPGVTFLLAMVSGFAKPALAACSFVPTGGDDIHVCDAGASAGSLSDAGGDNALEFPSGGSGLLDGNVTFGGGADRVDMTSGAITGGVDLGGGADSFVIASGRVVGNVQQGDGIDDFHMSGGEIGSLNQGDNRDTFTMSGGRVVDAFDDGDRATMTGGRIGRVNMKLDDNLFDMSGGTIDRNLVAGFGNDTILLSGGLVAGNVSVSGGTDRVSVTGGTVGGAVLTSFGADTFAWAGGGILYGAVDLGGDDDTAMLADLTDANMGRTPALSGGPGVDRLTLDNVKTGGVARFQDWESIGLTNDSRLIFDGALVLGDSGSGTGALSIDATSTLFGGGAVGAVRAAVSGRRASVTNAGRIDLSNGGTPGDTFTIAGDYEGRNGLLFVDTALGDDGAPSDRLVIDGGMASGATGLTVVEAGGSGAATVRDGIMVVEAANGGATAPGTFALSGRVAAGAYEYLLFRGGISPDTGDNWYLRSALVAPPPGPGPIPSPSPGPDPLAPAVPEPVPEPPVTVAPAPISELPDTPLPDEGTPTVGPVDPGPPIRGTDPEPEAPPAPPPAAPPDPPPPPPASPGAPLPLPGPGREPPTPGATPVEAAVVPLYRVEVPAYSVVPPVAQVLLLSTLGTFHERRGEQALLRSAGRLPAAWVRTFGQHADLAWSGTVDPGVEGDLYGVQVGQDLLGREADGHIDRFGLFVGHAHFDGDTKGQALGWNDLAAGDIDVGGTSLGAYWTRVAASGWYVDGVLMGTWFDGEATAATDESVDVAGSALTASVEGGYPLALSERWIVEPQGQLIWSELSLDDQDDSISSVSFDADDALTGRIGFRFKGVLASGGRTVEPYLKANIWHDFSSDDAVTFDRTSIVTELGGTTLEVGGGILVDLDERISLFATADYTTDLGGEDARILEGNLGLDIRF